MNSLSHESTPKFTVSFPAPSGHQLAEAADSDTTVYLWYIGSHGLKHEAISFYQPHISTLWSRGATIKLYDLTAWSVFSGIGKLDHQSRHVAAINLFAIERIQAIASSDFIHWLKKPPNPEYMQKTLLVREEIYKLSADIPEAGLKMGQVFGDEFPLLAPLQKLDVARCYSALQYLEGIYLVETALKTQPKRICFHLVNHERNYYPAPFAKDLTHLIQTIHDVSIEFWSTSYGEAAHHRPYNRGKALKGSLTPNDLLTQPNQKPRSTDDDGKH
ncbi:MAG: hypothetical protein KGJ02_06505 [Verrucomicrobiota bacterium]|nr:hypothetical protein [Verrucomicrobiota bacterium]